MNYVKLKKSNDWGSTYYAVYPHTYRRNGGASYNRGIKISEGEMIPVRWPSSYESVERMVIRKVPRRVSDMGHVTEFNDSEMGILTTVNRSGFPPVFIELDQVGIGQEFYEAHRSKEDKEQEESNPAAEYHRETDPAIDEKFDAYDVGSTWVRCAHKCRFHEPIPTLTWDGEQWVQLA